jgi:hypothetical protein
MKEFPPLRKRSIIIFTKSLTLHIIMRQTNSVHSIGSTLIVSSSSSSPKPRSHNLSSFIGVFLLKLYINVSPFHVLLLLLLLLLLYPSLNDITRQQLITCCLLIHSKDERTKNIPINIFQNVCQFSVASIYKNDLFQRHLKKKAKNSSLRFHFPAEQRTGGLGTTTWSFEYRCLSPVLILFCIIYKMPASKESEYKGDLLHLVGWMLESMNCLTNTNCNMTASKTTGLCDGNSLHLKVKKKMVYLSLRMPRSHVRENEV